MFPVALLSGCIFIYAAIRYAFGRKALRRELESFAKLQLLRRELNLENPALLLPR